MSDGQDTSELFNTAAEFASYVNNNLDGKPTELHSHAGLVDSGEEMEFLNMLQNAYRSDHKELPHKFKDTKLGQILIKNSATKLASKAVSEGNIGQMKRFTGKQSYKTDSSGIHALRKLRSEISKDAYIQYLFGHMGNGKTDFAILQGELAKKELGFKIITNIKSLEEKDAYVETYGDLLKELANGQEVSNVDEIVESDIDTSNILFIFDEASSHASGYSDDAYETQKKLGVMVKKVRKVSGRIIVIGHTGKDLHPDVKRLCDCVHKTSKKTANYYKSVDEQGNGVNKQMSVKGIPKTNWDSYDTNEITSWDWSEIPADTQEESKNDAKDYEYGKERRNVLIAKALVTNDHPDIEPNENDRITQEMLGDYYGLSTGRVSQIMKELQKEDT